MTAPTDVRPDPTAPPPALARCRDLVEPVLRAALHGLHPWPRRMAWHALGRSPADGAPDPAGGGKGVRQALAVLGAEAVGAPTEAAVAAAVAVELVHTFSLMHDDIMDGDERRRHRESSWKAFGTGPAVLGGDALFALSVETLARAGGGHGAAAVAHLAAALRELVGGQADDLLFETRPWRGPGAVTPAEYEAMVAGKTGSLLGCALSLGPVSPAPPRRSSPRSPRPAGTSAPPSRPSTTCWASGATPPPPANPCTPTSAAARRPSPSSPRSPATPPPPTACTPSSPPAPRSPPPRPTTPPTS